MINHWELAMHLAGLSEAELEDVPEEDIDEAIDERLESHYGIQGDDFDNLVDDLLDMIEVDLNSKIKGFAKPLNEDISIWLARKRF